MKRNNNQLIVQAVPPIVVIGMHLCWQAGLTLIMIAGDSSLSVGFTLKY